MRKPTRIEEILPDIMQGLNRKTNKDDILTQAWKKAAGEKIASRTKPVCIKEGRLFVETDSSSWTHIAVMQRHTILEKLNKFLGENKINDIIFRSSGTNRTG